MKKRVSIIVPAYDEEQRLGQTIDSICRFINEESLDAELLIVDDGSSDNTVQVAEQMLRRFPTIRSRILRYEENRGKGYAVRIGLLESVSDIAVFSDADLSTPIDEFSKLVEPIEQGEFDVTIGSRALDRTLIGLRQPWLREQSGKVFNRFVRVLTGLPFWDTQCGFKAFRMSTFRELIPLMGINRFGFDVELLLIAKRRGLRLKEIPVRWNNDENTKVKVLRDSWRMINEVRQIRVNSSRGIYDVQKDAELKEVFELT